jgi:E3 ubiquitin-protein ligase HUWE1
LVTRIKDEVDSLLALVKGTDAPQMETLSNKGTLDWIPVVHILIQGSCPRSPSYDIVVDDTFPVPFERTALLKAMFKFVLHMMQNPGSQEGLRNLIDTTLPSTLKDIMERPDIVGPAVFAHGKYHFYFGGSGT